MLEMCAPQQNTVLLISKFLFAVPFGTEEINSLNEACSQAYWSNPIKGNGKSPVAHL